MSEIPPSPNGPDGRAGRDPTTGRFKAGWRGGPGNPYVKRVAALRAALLNSVTEKDIRQVVAALLSQAKQGDVTAIRELFLRLLGPPVEADLIARIDALEAANQPLEDTPS